MAVLEQLETGARCVLLSRHLVGRSRAAHLRLPEPHISGEHATLRWNGREWELSDLASRNGTTVDGRRLGPGERAALSRGMLIGFGTQGPPWRLVDDAPPTATALPEDGAPALVARDELLALPGEDAPELEVYRDRTGDWVVDRGGDTSPLRDGERLSAGGRHFTLHLPDVVPTTWDGAGAPLRLERIGLRFAVTRDEEHVELCVLTDAGPIDLGSRAHYYVLLTLARLRQQEAQAAAPATPERSLGWVYQEELSRMLGMDEQHLNVAVYRCRRQLAAAGIQGAAGIVERRTGTRQLRLGVGRVEISSL